MPTVTETRDQYLPQKPPALPIQHPDIAPAPPEHGCPKCRARRLFTGPVVADTHVAGDLWQWACLCGWEGRTFRWRPSARMQQRMAEGRGRTVRR